MRRWGNLWKLILVPESPYLWMRRFRPPLYALHLFLAIATARDAERRS
jgi:hypothetical protein